VNTGVFWNIRAMGAVVPLWSVFSEYLDRPQLGDPGYEGRPEP
jgi:hypothetical protein